MLGFLKISIWMVSLSKFCSTWCVLAWSQKNELDQMQFRRGSVWRTLLSITSQFGPFCSSVVLINVLIFLSCRYLAGGPFYERYSASVYRISKSSSSKILSETCQAIYEELSKTEFMEYTENNWLNVAAGFEAKWDMPHCIGALDGKHIRITCPANAGSLYYNHKVLILHGISFFLFQSVIPLFLQQRYHSMILMASCDADYRFTTFNIGAPGSDGDVNAFARSTFGSDILADSDNLNLPQSSLLDGRETPYFLVADDAFPLSCRIMKPYGNNLSNEKKIFNYRLSRARRTIENVFGILGKRWGCLQTEFSCKPDKVKVIVSACCALHNFLLNRRCSEYTDRLDEMAENCIEAAASFDGISSFRGRPKEAANNLRERLTKYLSYVFTLPWQFERAHCTPNEIEND